MGVGAGVYMCVVVVQKFTFAISSPDEFLFMVGIEENGEETNKRLSCLRGIARRTVSTEYFVVLIISYVSAIEL